MSAAKVSAYDPVWPRRYQQEAPSIARALAPIVAIEHVGSTSVPGLASKPTIDIAVGVETLALDPSAWQRMEALGYHYGGDHGQRQHVFRKGASVPWQFLVHVVEHDGQMWQDYLRFRDHLRAHPDDAQRYAELKETLLLERDGWYRGADKAVFIHPILQSPTSSTLAQAKKLGGKERERFG